MKEIRIKVLTTGYLVSVYENGEIVEEAATSNGKWNIGPVINKYLYEDDGYTSKGSKKTTKKKSKKKAVKRKL